MKKYFKLGVFTAALLTVSGLITLYNLGGIICSVAKNLLADLIPGFHITINF